MAAEYVQFGCGSCAPADWRNFDASLTLWTEKRFSALKPFLVRRGFADYPRNVEHGCIVKGLSVAPNSIKGVYSSHVLEHLSLDECCIALRNVFRYLEPGGYFRFVLPDLEYMILNYCKDADPEAAVRFIEATGMGETNSTRGLGNALRAALGRSQHRWMWDFKSLAKEPQNAGFTDVRRAKWGDAHDGLFLSVEDPERWGNNLGIECRRPLAPRVSLAPMESSRGNGDQETEVHRRGTPALL